MVLSMPQEDSVMAEFTIREVREGNETKLQVVIHGDRVVAEGDLQPIGLTGHPLYSELFSIVLRLIKGS